MLDIVSFETAKKLKEAGFPQPEISDCFLYATLRGYSVLCLKAFRKTVIVGGGNGVLKDFLFAPTATDILRQMPGVYLCVNEKSLWRAEWAGVSCYDNTQPIAIGENPAEVAAAAWLLLKVRPIDLEITGNLNA